jgi:hypothetical protein
VLEEQILLTKCGQNVVKGVMMMETPVREKGLLLGDSIVRNVGAEKSNMRVSVFRVLEPINCED